MATGPTRHPARALAWKLIVIGVVWCGGTGLLAMAATPAVAALPALFGLWFVYLGARTLRDTGVAQLANTALDRLSRGHVDEAEALLDSIPRAKQTGAIRRAIDVQRSMIASRRGDMAGAIEHASRAIGGRFGLFTRSLEKLKELSARGVRAMALAAKGDADAAMADARALREAPLATAEMLAHGALAEAIVLSRANDREKLGALLARERRLLLEHTLPRERALVRTLQRSLHARAGSAYREPPGRDEPSSDAALASWMAGVAPMTAGISPVGGATARTAEHLPEAASIDARAAESSVNRRARFGGGKVVALWVALIVTFLAIWQFLSPGHPTHPASHAARSAASPDDGFSFAVFVLPLVVIGATLIATVYAAQRALRRLTEATRLLALPDLGPAERAFEALARSRMPIIAAQADLHLAGLSERRARFSDAIALCDRGLGRVAKNDGAREFLVPRLLSERAACLAATDRGQEAGAEIATITATHPTYPFLASARLRVQLRDAVRRGDHAAARDIAKQRTPDLPVSFQDELLADVVCATSDDRPAEDEIARLRSELQIDADLRAWLGAIWPEAERAIDRAAARAA